MGDFEKEYSLPKKGCFKWCRLNYSYMSRYRISPPDTNVIVPMSLHTEYGRPVRKLPTLHARPKINSHSRIEIFRYGQSIFCLPHWPKLSDFFEICLHPSVVCVRVSAVCIVSVGIFLSKVRIGFSHWLGLKQYAQKMWGYK